MKQSTDSIMPQTIRQTILDFLQGRLENKTEYKAAEKRLANAEKNNDIDEIQTAKNQLAEIVRKFEFTHWMEWTLTTRIGWITMATHLSKGIHPRSKGSNCNYIGQDKSPLAFAVSSSTVTNLPDDVTGNAAALDIVTLLNQKVNDEITLLQLIIDEHPAIMPALADDANQAKGYLANIQTFLQGNWQNPKSSGLNKQFYWPMREEAYLSAADNQYRLLVPLYPSSLCHVVFQKIQSRFSEENKQARTERFKKGGENKAYFSYLDLAVVQLSGDKPQCVGKLNSLQNGRNFLLPSIPPKIPYSDAFLLKKSAKTLFSPALRDKCREGFNDLFAVIAAKKSVVEVRDNRKGALDVILAIIFGIVKEMQTTRSPGWSRDYELPMAQKCWLDPGRNDIPGDDEFQQYYQADWVSVLEKQFSGWINSILKKSFGEKSADFKDAEFREWHREFHDAMKLSLRSKEGIFNGK